jgi:hypothetical protein
MTTGTGTIGDIRKKVTKTHELISTAYHESGHTVYALLHHMRVQSVCIFEDKKSKRIHGFTHYDSPEISTIKDFELRNTLILNEIKLSYAGLTAEKYHFKCITGSDKFPMFLKDGSSDDTLSAAALIKKYNLAPPGRKRYNFKQKLIRETLHEQQQHWDAVTVIAHALFQHKKLNYQDLRELLTKKTRNKKFWKEQFKSISFISDNAASLDENDLKSILSL